jgi:hypothetical protein
MRESDNLVRTVVDVRSEFRNRTIPAGTYGAIVERYEDPEGYAVDLGIPTPDLVGGFEYDNVVLRPGQFVFVDELPKSPYDND